VTELSGVVRPKPADTNNALDIGQVGHLLVSAVTADTNNYFWYRLETVDTKKTSFFISYKWYRHDGPVPKIPYQPIL
jgi:hypothetical protein